MQWRDNLDLRLDRRRKVTRQIGANPERLIAAADQGLYAAKKPGKDRYAIHDRESERFGHFNRCAGLREAARRLPMIVRLIAIALIVSATVATAGAEPPAQLMLLARSAGTPEIPGLKMIWLSPWGDRSQAPWRNIIVHQTEGGTGSARYGALEQAKNPTRRGVTVWVETDGTVYWSVPETAIPTHGDGANRNDNKFIDNKPTYHQVLKHNSIGVEFAGNFPDVTRPPSEAQIAAWRILVQVLRARYDIPIERVYAHNWIDYKDARYCEGCALATLARDPGF
jgi:hypothetical protein